MRIKLLKFTAPASSRRNLLLLLPVFLLLAGCVSTQKRYDKAVYLEGEGRYEEAAVYYVKVLRKDPAWPEAKDRLRESGMQVVDASLEHANALAAVENYEGAVQVLTQLDALRDQAAAVGVLLPVPEDYAQYRQDLTQDAVKSLIWRGEQAEAAGRWQDALIAYERALQRYDMSAEQRQDLNDARARVLVSWSEEDLGRQYFRAAHERAAHALEIAGPGSPMGRRALVLQDEALRAGTRRVVFLPVAVAARQPRGGASGAFLQDLNEALQYEYWERPPLFIASANSGDVYRELRRYRDERRPIGLGDAAEVGRALSADLVVLSDLSDFEREETVVREQKREVRTRGRTPVDTSYVEQIIDVELTARVAFQVIDPITRDILYEGSAQASAKDREERGVYDGDVRTLDLPASARRLFDRKAQDRFEQELETELVDELSDHLARQAYDTLLRGIR